MQAQKRENQGFRNGWRLLGRHDERTRNRGIRGLDWEVTEIMDHGFWAGEKRVKTE